MKTTSNEKIHTKHRGVSPILATVVLLGITVAAGGLAFSILQEGTQTATSSNVILVENAQAVKGTDHADITATVKNAGNKQWEKLQMTVGKSELSEPLLYESLHENVAGCTETTFDSTLCKDDVGSAGSRDNPLRAQWIISLDKEGGEDDRADPGEGASVGRKLVFDKKDDYRTVDILAGTSVAPLFGGTDSLGNTDASTDMAAYLTAITGTECDTATTGTDVDCTDIFKALDAKTKGNVFCSSNDDPNIVTTCKVFTHQSIKDNPVKPGETKYFYADALIKSIPGLNNLFVSVGDSLVVNLVADATDGSSVRSQTIIKVTGV